MIRSMTGYSRVETEEAGFALVVSIRATNHRFLDPQVRVPSAWKPWNPSCAACSRNTLCAATWKSRWA